MKRTLWITLLALLLACACFAAAAETDKLTLVMIGGDGDHEDSPNNVFRNILDRHGEFGDQAEAFFVRSKKNDYSNKTAQKWTKMMQEDLSPDGINIVAAFSHGGQSVYFLDTATVRDLFLFDACVSIGGKCQGPVPCGQFWSQWIVDTAKTGVHLHLYASAGKKDEPSGSKYAVEGIAQIAQEDPAVEDLGDGCYRILDEDGSEVSLVETFIREGTHRDICPSAEPDVEQLICSLLE